MEHCKTAQTAWTMPTLAFIPADRGDMLAEFRLSQYVSAFDKADIKLIRMIYADWYDWDSIKTMTNMKPGHAARLRRCALGVRLTVRLKAGPLHPLCKIDPLLALTLTFTLD